MTTLDEIIRAEMKAHGPMRFDRFMELALYYPELGYYAKTNGPAPIGKHGDFYTSVSVGPLFGRLLARQFFQMWHLLGKPNPFWIIEQGAHDGQLACDILDWCRTDMPEFLASIRYGIVQATGALRIKQKCAPDQELISHLTWFENIGELTTEKPVGVFFSNELVDAFPVRSIAFRTDRWLEQYVTTNKKGEFDWLEFPIDDEELSQAIKKIPLTPTVDYTTEVNLLARSWIEGVANAMERGYVLTIDYGYPASVYYADFRTGGTLTAYVKHKPVDEVLDEPGMRDITAHIDFTALMRDGEGAGLTTLGFLDQQRFLMGVAHDELNGALEHQVEIQKNLRAWNTLTHPDFLGADFFMLLQSKNAPATEIEGLRFARPSDLLK